MTDSHKAPPASVMTEYVSGKDAPGVWKATCSCGAWAFHPDGRKEADAALDHFDGCDLRTPPSGGEGKEVLATWPTRSSAVTVEVPPGVLATGGGEWEHGDPSVPRRGEGILAACECKDCNRLRREVMGKRLAACESALAWAIAAVRAVEIGPDSAEGVIAALDCAEGALKKARE